MSDPKKAFEDFILEKTYKRTLQLRAHLEEHYWSRRITQSDATIVNETIKELQEIANTLYLVREFLVTETDPAPLPEEAQ